MGKVAPGRILMVGIPGPELDADTRTLLRQHEVGGVILFRRNVHDPAQLTRLVRDLHAVSPEHPLLVGIDHEGGRVQRLGAPFTHFPPAARIGKAGSPHLAYRIGLAMAEELRSVGIDLNFAPVLDVNSNPANPVIGDRSFSSNPRTVARMGTSLLRGLRRLAILPCAKHFPGHGDTDRDSHLELPVVRRSLAEIERTELYPFRRAIASGLDAIMTAHVVFTAIDDEPATLSRRVLTDLLRERLRFRGVVFSDDLEMKAITSRLPIAEAAVASVSAGADCLLVCETTSLVAEIVEALARAAARPEIRRRLDDAIARIDRMRRGHFRRRRTGMPLPDDAFERHANLVRWVDERSGA